MATNTLRVIIEKDKTFTRRTSIATWIASALIAIGAYHALDVRISSLETQANKSVDVFLESAEPITNPTLPNALSSKLDDKIAHLYHVNYKVVMDDDDIRCLAKNIFHEARYEPYIGQIAIAQVTFNRVLDGRWGDTICKVVYAKKQFSWTTKASLRKRDITRTKKWKEALHVARMFQGGVRVRKLSNAKWYHARYVSPKWRHDFRTVHQYGLHIFYEENKKHHLTEQQLLMASK